MIRAYAVPTVRAVEDAAMAALPDGELMARAARGLAKVARARLRELGGTRVVALVGAGNNGGDALYAVARLAKRGYAAAAVVPSQSPVHVGGLQACRKAGVLVVEGSGSESPWAALIDEADVVLDGITGIGGRPGLRDEAARWASAIPADAWVIAVDLPSGTDPDGRLAARHAVVADETVTFGAPKPVHLLGAAADACGRLSVVDIGLDFADAPVAVEQLTHDDVARLWPVPGPVDHKYTRGVVGVVAGSTAYPGAAVLGVLGALGVGPGMVRYTGPDQVKALVHAHAPEVVTMPGRVQSWVLGSGVDPADPRAAASVAEIRSALATHLPAVVDAGALALLGSGRAGPTVITPHAGELAALLTQLGQATTRDDVEADPVAASTRAADLLNACVVLKGAFTLVVAPTAQSQPVRVSSDAPAWLGTAGAGDVLAGMIGTLLAAGLPPRDAASLAVLVHGVAAAAVSDGGPLRILDLAHALPRTVARLLRP